MRLAENVATEIVRYAIYAKGLGYRLLSASPLSTEVGRS
jgi:hypothetical protein